MQLYSYIFVIGEQICYLLYEVRDLFSWEILTKIVMQYLLKVEK